MAKWSVEDSSALYRVDAWGKGYFEVGDNGHLQVCLDENRIDLKTLCDELGERGLTAPLLLRFSDILRGRMQKLHSSFAKAREAANYQGRYYGVYPIKVNQQCQTIEEIVEFGSEFNWGLEAGSKPELHATLAMLEDVEGLIVCNGYKDREFIYLALLGQKMGKRVFIVVEKPSELELIIELAKQVDVEPLIGLRCRLAATSEGQWKESGGDASKFGLSPQEILAAVNRLKACDMLDSLKLLHFHIGSQVPRIRHIKTALQEVGRFYVELRKLGAPVEYIDVGGGLGVDYDGSFSGRDSSVDYSIGEYASDIVWQLASICDDEELPHPNIISESGRSLVAHHSVLIINVLGTSRRTEQGELIDPGEDAPMQLRQLYDTYASLDDIVPREAFHDAQAQREDVHRLFSLGHCSLEQRALADACYWRIIDRLMPKAEEDPSLEQAMEALRPLMADRYFCNFSVFQSLPDAWAINQIFPVAPIHRLDEEPTRSAILVDVTCDSDGKLTRFPGEDGVQRMLPLHAMNNGDDYLLGIFLVGAYQEILGDLHNLFGDTHTVHVRMDGDQVNFEQVVEGETVAEVLDYVQFHEKVLMDRMRRQLQEARTAKRLTAREANAFLRFYQEGLRGYTYLEEHLPPA